jgi:hypothetical protein
MFVLTSTSTKVVHKAVGENSKPVILQKLLDADADLLAASDTGNTILHEVKDVAAARLVLKKLDVKVRCDVWSLCVWFGLRCSC